MVSRADSFSGRRGAGRERAVLGLTLAAALALVVAAFAAPFDPERAGRDALRRGVDAAAELLRGEWARMLATGELGAPASEELSWTTGEPAPPRRAPREARADDPAGAAGLSIVLGLAEQAELGGPERAPDLARAAELYASGAEVPGASAGQRALLALRRVQLAARAEDAAAARAAWAVVREEVAGDAVVGGAPVRLLAALAVAPQLDPNERRALRLALEGEWAAGELALGDEEPRVVVAGADSLRVRLEPAFAALALRERLRALAPAASEDPALGARFARLRTSAIERALDGLPEAPAGGAPALVDTALGPLWLRPEPGGARARFIDLGAARAELIARAAGRLPEELSCDPDAGQPVGAPLLLAAGALELQLVHADPDALVRGEARRARLLRGALLALAAALAMAGAATFRALRRERRLGELRSRFVADVSHELRTPLASILLMAENLCADRVPTDAARGRYHDLIRREATRLARLVDDVLDFSRIERGEPPRLRAAPVELAALSQGLERELGARLAELGVEARFTRGALAGAASVDLEALRRAALNLVENAARHGAPPVEVALGVSDGSFELAVRDHGPGLGPADRERAFRPFERLAPDAAPGTGLGLAIVREIARAHGGEACAREPDEGAGVAFVLRLPLA